MYSSACVCVYFNTRVQVLSSCLQFGCTNKQKKSTSLALFLIDLHLKELQEQIIIICLYENE